VICSRGTGDSMADPTSDTAPLVSILIPAWNAQATIRAAISSVQRQSYAAWECVVVDDGSSDETAQVVERVAAADPRFRLVRVPRGGLVPALNEGLAHCKGAFIARMDADDLMHRHRLARQVALLERDRTLAAVGCHVRIFPRATMSARLREYEAWLNSLQSADDVARDAFVECPVAHPTLMMRAEMAQLRYCDRGWPEDYDFVLRALAAGLRIAVVPGRLVAWRDRPDSLCRTDRTYDGERFTACKAHYLSRGFLSGEDTYVLWGYGDTGRTLRTALAREGKSPSHIVEVKTSRIGQQIHGAPVVAVSDVPALRGRRVVVSVARAAPRAEIRAALTAMQFLDGVDFVCAA
jgi:glycosyltransferase involved in cell wall biosynthesis